MEKIQQRPRFIFETGFFLKMHVVDAKVKANQQILHIMLVS